MSEWRQTNGFNPLRKTKLSALSDAELRGLAKDMAGARTYHLKMGEAFGRAIKDVNREISHRGVDAKEVVTDHAIVRYLERHNGMNLEKIRDAIRRLDGDMAPRNGHRISTVLPPEMQR